MSLDNPNYLIPRLWILSPQLLWSQFFMAEIPTWIQHVREKWKYCGQVRPAFAKLVKKGQESVWDYPRPPRVEAD